VPEVEKIPTIFGTTKVRRKTTTRAATTAIRSG